jgi:hypothetical protein
MYIQKTDHVSGHTSDIIWHPIKVQGRCNHSFLAVAWTGKTFQLHPSGIKSSVPGHLWVNITSSQKVKSL